MSDITQTAISLLAPSDRMRAKDYAGYSLEWLPLAASQANAKASFTVASDTAFVGLYFTGLVTDTATPPVKLADAHFLLALQLADRQLFDKPIHWGMLAAGTAAFPFILPFPLWLDAATTLTGYLTNLHAVAYNARLTLHGFVLHTYGRAQSRGF